MATTATVLAAGFGAAAHAATPIVGTQLQSNVGTTVLPDFQGGTLRDDVNAVTDTHAYTVENFPTNTIDEFGNTVTFTGAFSGAGPLTFTDSVGGGNAIFTGTSVLGGSVTIGTGAQLTWGNGTGGAFLIGPGNAITDNGSLVMDFGGASGVVGAVPISGTGSVTVHTGLFEELGPATYTGGTTIDAGGTLTLGNGGSTVGTVIGAITDNGALKFDYAGAAPVTTANAISGAGAVEFVSGTTVITDSSAVGGAVTIDVGATSQWGDGTGGAFLVGGSNVVTDNGALVMNFGPSGIVGDLPLTGTGTLEIQSGLFEQTGATTITGATTVDAGGKLELGAGGATGTVAGAIVDNGLVQFNHSGSVTLSSAGISGSGAVEIVAGTLVDANTDIVGGSVTIDTGAQLTWGNGTGGAFLLGSGNAVTDNGSLVMDFGGASGVVGAVPISGTGGVTVHTGLFEELGPATYTGGTTIDAAGTLTLGNGGSTVGTVVGAITDNGDLKFDYAGAAPVTSANAFSGSGSAEVVAGTVVITSTGFVGGNVTIDPGATMQWGAGGGPAFLVGAGDSVVDNGSLLMDFGGGGIAGSIPISGSGGVEVESGSLNDSGVSTYTGVTTIDAAGFLALSGTGSIADSSNVIDNGTFDISGTAAGASITTLSGAGGVSLGAQTLTLTNASGNFSGVMADGGLFGGTGGALTIAGGTETLTGTNTFTGFTTTALGATLRLGNGGTTGTVAGAIVDNGLVQFDYSGPVTTPNSFSGSGSAEVVAGTVVITSTGFVGGNVTIDPGATMQWGAGGPAFLVGAGDSVVDNGSLLMDFGGGGIAGSIPISGSGSVEIENGSLNDSGASTYTGVTTIDAAGVLALSATGSIADSANVIDNGTFDISGTAAGASITTLTGAGGVSLGAQTLTLTNASGAFSGVLADGGVFGGTAGGLTIGGGTETLTGTNTYTGATTIDLGATLKLGAGGTTGTVAGAIVDNGLVQFDYSGPVTTPNAFSGSGSAEVVAGTVVITSTGFVGGNVTIDPGATMQWGAGGPAFLVGAGNSVVDNGSLLMDFGGGGIGGSIPISGSGGVEVESGSLNDSGTSTYTGVTTVDAAGVLVLTGAGSIADSSNVLDNGTFDISGTAAGASITTLSGAGGASLGAQTLTLTNASGTFSGVLADGGVFGGTGGRLTIAAGTETLTGTNTFTGLTTIDLGATLKLGAGGTTGTVAGSIVDNGLVQFDYSGLVTTPNAFSGSGSAEVVAGTVVVTGNSFVGGNVTIDPGATLQWGAGGPAFLVGEGNSVVDNGSLLMNFGGGGIAGAIPISGTGGVEVESGSLNDSGTSTYTGVTTIDAAGVLALSGAGSIADSANVLDNGTFDISGTTAGAAITTLSGAGGVSLGGQTLTLTNASGTFSGVLADGGLFGGTGGRLTVAGGTETLTGINTFTGLTTIDLGATLKLVGAGSIAQSGDPLVNGTFDISGAGGGVSVISLSGSGQVLLGANTLTLTNAMDTFSGGISGAGGLTIGAGAEVLTGVNSFTGVTTIDPGATLQLGAGGGPVGLAGAIADNGLLIFDGGAASNASLATGITGSGAMTLETGTLGLTGTNTYSGATTIDAGATLQLGNGGTTGTVAGAIVDNGLAKFDYSGPVTIPGAFSGSGSAEVVAGTLVVTSGGVLGGAVTIDNGATLQWGAGAAASLVGGGNAVIDNGALVMNFGGGGITGAFPISGSGSVTLQSGSLNESGVSTYTGATTINAGASLLLSGVGSIATSSNVNDNGTFDISGTTAGVSIITLTGAGGVSLGAQTLTLTNASGTFAGVLADGGNSGGSGGALTLAGGGETLTGGNAYTGATTIAAGATLQLGAGGTTGSVFGPVADNGTLIVDRSNLVVFNRPISGAGAINQVGAGTTVFNAVNPFSGATTVSAGVLEVGDAGTPGATLGGSVAIGANGTLMGHGTIAGSVTNAGVVAPGGGGIGTLTVGVYTQAPGGTLAIEVSPTAASMLNVTGPASLNGKLAVSFDPGAYSAHKYEIVSGHTVTGTFSTVDTVGPVGQAFGLFYAPTEVDLVTEATASAQIYGAVSTATLDRAENFATLVEDRFGEAGCPDGSSDRSAPACQGYGAWAFAIGSRGSQGANSGASGYRNDGAGVVGGIDRSWQNGSLVGAAFGYAHNDLTLDAAAAKATGPSYYASIYGRLVDRGIWFDGEVFYMHTGWSVNRTIPGGAEVATASPNANTEGFLLQASAPIGETGLRPYARFTYAYSSRGAALEQGVGPLGFAIDSLNQNAGVAEVGMIYAPTVTTSSGTVLQPAILLGAQDNTGEHSQTVSGSLAGVPASGFQQIAPHLWGAASVVEGSLKVRVNQSFELFGDVRGRFGEHQTDGVASVGGVIRF